MTERYKNRAQLVQAVGDKMDVKDGRNTCTPGEGNSTARQRDHAPSQN